MRFGVAHIVSLCFDNLDAGMDVWFSRQMVLASASHI